MCVVLYVSVCTLPVCPMSKKFYHKSIQYKQVVCCQNIQVNLGLIIKLPILARLNKYCDHQKVATSLPEIVETIHLYYMFHSHVDEKLRADT